jgi:hypothetical protein
MGPPVSTLSQATIICCSSVSTKVAFVIYPDFYLMGCFPCKGQRKKGGGGDLPLLLAPVEQSRPQERIIHTQYP